MGYMFRVQKWVRVLGATPTINCLQWSSSGLHLAYKQELVLHSLLSLVARVSFTLIFGGLNMVAILESLSLDYSSYGQVARFIVLMELNKVQLENIIYHVILL